LSHPSSQKSADPIDGSLEHSGQTLPEQYKSFRSCFDLFEMFFEVKNLHFLPASSVRQHRYPPWKKRSKRKFFTLNPAPEPSAIERVRIAEVSSRERACS